MWEHHAYAAHMGWGDTADGPEGDRPGETVQWFVDLNAASAVCAAQLPAIGLVWWIGAELGDDYGGSPYTLAMALVLAALLVVAPLVLPFVGLVQAAAQIVPGGRLARVVTPHVRGPVWAWHMVCSALLGVVWAALAAVVWDWRFTVVAPLFAALGVLPVLGPGYFRRRARVTGRRQGFWAVWLLSLFASVALFLLVSVGGVAATAAGLIGYRPPELSTAQLTGVWRGVDGAALRLDADGKAELTGLATESESGDRTTDPIDVCDGPGTWSAEERGGRDAVVVRLDGTCGRATWWMIGGTESDPELFARFGDPDAGEVWILTRGRADVNAP